MRNLLRAAILGGFFMWSSAHAGTVCGLRENFVVLLDVDYGEGEVGRGLTPSGHLIELFVSPQRSFTILLTTPEGFSCVVATGQDWDTVNAAASTSPLSRDRVH